MTKDTTLYAEDVNYFQTSRTSPDTWVDKAKKLIESFGGKVKQYAFGADSGRAAYMLLFEANEQQFKIVWPVLPSRKGNEQAARIQAATMMYHDIKAKCISAEVIGVRTAFFAHLLLPDGRTASQTASPQDIARLPQLIARANLQQLE